MSHPGLRIFHTFIILNYSCAFPARGDLKEIFYNLTGGHESEDRKKIKGNQVIYSTFQDEKGVVIKNDKCISNTLPIDPTHTYTDVSKDKC